jgi:hypothetical protein
MRTLLYIPFLTFFSCSSPTKPADIKSNSVTITNPRTTKADNSKYYTSKETVLIATEIGDTLKYSKADFNDIIDKHPEFFSDNVQDPDPTYYCAAYKHGFNSEAGQDEYYMLYAYFLKQKNGIDKYADRRQKLIDIYADINSLYQRFQHGGTYFGHQGARILGYAEFSVCLYKSYENDLSKTYDISKQKRLYIQSLRQLIDDELRVDGETLEREKKKRKQELNTTVDNIDKAITDNFYLRRAQEFQYEHYQYY